MQQECASVTQSTHPAGEVSLWGSLWESREDRVIHNTMGEVMGNASYSLGFFLVLRFLVFIFSTVQYFPVLLSLRHKK